MNNKYTDNAYKALKYAEELATRTGGVLGTEHVLYGLAKVEEGVAAKLLKEAGVSVKELESEFSEAYGGGVAQMSPRVKHVLMNAMEVAVKTGSGYITTEHLLFALLYESESYAVRMLVHYGVDVRKLATALSEYFSGGTDGQAGEQAHTSHEGGKVDSELAKLGVDLTEKAREGKLDPVIGRKDEVERIIQILSRRTKNNPVLIGEPGVGKSAIVEGLAQAIVSGEVPEILKGKRIFSLDMASVVAGTKYRGEFEERLKNAIEKIKSSKDTIMFIDEIHTIVGAGGAEGAVDAANILKPMLARGELQTIGATTLDEYRKHIEKDAALERRFQPVTVDPPSVEDTIKILTGVRDKYEAHHKVRITDEAIKAAAVLSDRYITDRFLPDKAIDLIDEAASKKRISSYVAPPDLNDLEAELTKVTAEKNEAAKAQEYEKAGKLLTREEELKKALAEKKSEWEKSRVEQSLQIGEDEIAEIVSKWTSVPVVKLTEDESQRLMNLENVLHKRVIGQDEAVSAVSNAIRRARAGLKDPKRPVGTFIFLGPTGVGKTELTKALAEAMFGDENLLIRIDMSEYMQKENVSKLIGSAPGYVGFDEGGQLTEKVRRKPYSVILFDEIEKAHPDVFNILLQILDDGRLTDSHGRTVSFKNTVVIMTSNVGASEVAKVKKLGFTAQDTEKAFEDMRERQYEALKRTFKPEFLNRIDDIIMFTRLERSDIEKICDIMTAGLAKRLNERNIQVEITPEAKAFLVEKGYDSEYGARPLRRAIQRYLENALSEEILKNNVSAGSTVIVGAGESALTFTEKK